MYDGLAPIPGAMYDQIAARRPAIPSPTREA
jgi:hypothetical protein